MFLTLSKKLYICGINERGQLGLGHNKNTVSPNILYHKVDKLMNRKVLNLDWNIERLLWLAKMKNKDSKLSLLPNEILCHLRTFII